MKNNRGHAPLRCGRAVAGRRGSVLHGGQRLGEIARGPHRQSRVNADRCKHVGVGGRDDGRHGPAGRQARHINAPLVDGQRAHQLLRQLGNPRRLTLTTALVRTLKPVPTALRVRCARLTGVQHIESGAVGRAPGQAIHGRPNRKVVGVLGAAVQHHHQRQERISGLLRRRVKLVVVRLRVAHELAAGKGVAWRRRVAAKPCGRSEWVRRCGG